MFLQKEKWKQRMPLLASFFIPLIITIIICIDHNVFPFGDQCILHVDMYHQYCPFFTEMMDKLKEGGSFLYSWNVGLGSDFVSLYAYYLASPMNWLLFICPSGYVIEFMTLLILLKIALSGLTFGIYLKMHFKKNHFAISLFASAYALSAFVAAYSWDIMWMDCIFLAPLIILGLEELVKEGKGVLYTVALAVSILSNYYISIMICIFLVIYFVILWFESDQNRLKSIYRFAGYSLLAGGMGAVLLIPEMKILSYSGSSGISFPDTVEWYFNLIAELARSCVITAPYTGRDHWPNIYCGVFMLLLIVLYALNRKISWKKKVPRLLFLAFFILSFANNMLDFVWHGLHFPDSLPGRQSFLYVFLLLTVGYETFLHLRGTRPLHVGIAVVLSMVLILVGQRVSDESLIDGDAFIMTAVLIGCYAVILVFYLIGNKKVKRGMLRLACVVVVAELTLNFDLTGFDTTSRTAYVEDQDDYQEVLEEAAELEEATDEVSFYRTEEIERKTKNDAALFDYESATQFSSLMNINVSRFYRKIGMEGGKNFYCINGATPLFSAMLSLKYVIADNDMEAGPLRSLVAESGDTYLYENRYVLPLGYMIDEDVIDAWDYDQGDEIKVQNDFASLLGAEEDMLKEIDAGLVTTESGKTTIEIPTSGYYYVTYESTTTDNLTELTSDGRTRSFTKCSHGYTLDLGFCEAGSTVEITNSDGAFILMDAYLLNLDSLNTAYQTLNAQTMELTSFSDTLVTGTIDVTSAGRLVFSIPDEEGWSVYVDGEKVDSQDFGDTFIGVHLDEGTHEIVLKYQTPGLLIGAAISGSCLVIFLAVTFWKRKREKERITTVNEEKMC